MNYILNKIRLLFQLWKFLFFKSFLIQDEFSTSLPVKKKIESQPAKTKNDRETGGKYNTKPICIILVRFCQKAA